jgi:hypothetical protein
MQSPFRDALYDARRHSYNGKDHYYPPATLSELVTKDAIRATIANHPAVREDERELFVHLIAEHIPKIYCILIYIHQEEHLPGFLYRRQYDSKLPFSRGDLVFLPVTAAADFVERQWQFIPVCLKRGEIHRELRKEEILPFEENEPVGEGSYGEVFKVKLSPGCHNFWDGADSVRIKLIKPSISILM